MRLLVLFLLCSGLSFAQNWAPNGAQWHYSYYGFFPGYVDIAYSGDTLIDGQVTKKLTKTFHGLGWGMDVTPYSIGTEYTYEANGVVYLRYQNQWDTLYNFSAQVGDSWRMAKQPFANVAPQNSRLKVIATGTKVINSNTLKYVKIDFVDPQMNPLGFEDTIVENIGFIGSYFLPYDMFDGAVDGNDRPLFAAALPQNAAGLITQGSTAGTVAGLQLVVDANIDTGAGVLGIVYPSDAATFYKSAAFQIRSNVVSTAEVEVGIYGYVALAPKYPTAFRKVT